GNYAIKPIFSDGHASGIYSWDLLYDLGKRHDELWADYLARLEAAQKSGLHQIGHFGVGFYSAFLVADFVEVISRAAGSREAWKWSSSGRGTFRIEAASRAEQGTSVILHLKPDHLEYLYDTQIERLVREWSDYLPWPIELRLPREKSDIPRYRRINSGQALWQRSPREVTREQYEEFYKHLTRDWDPPLAYKHFKIEGTTEFAGIVFIPRRAPFDLFSPDAKHGLRLHVKRVFVMDEADELLPRWLRFVRGVVDSEDLPLNVSRELLQDSRITRTIRQQVTKQVLDLLGEIARERPEDYRLFWRTFGAVLKEGLHYDPDQTPRLIPLLRYETTHGDGLYGLLEVKARMKEGQKHIYYAVGESTAHLRKTPQIEGLVARGFEVVLMGDPVDGWAVRSLKEVEGVPLADAMRADLDLGESASKPQADESQSRSLRERIRKRLQDEVQEVRISTRLAHSPACLVRPTEALPHHIERILRATQPDFPKAKPILEINPDHPIITGLSRLIDMNANEEAINLLIDSLYAQALWAEGTMPDEPAKYAKALAWLLEQHIARASAEEPQKASPNP
ncbi:MAG: molecular chaperone HtpG, partial [Deltaproteobacteria bacterium]|nr:molecular chaperone HtpG [Deltaproteobacteria bacterium]